MVTQTIEGLVTGTFQKGAAHLVTIAANGNLTVEGTTAPITVSVSGKYKLFEIGRTSRWTLSGGTQPSATALETRSTSGSAAPATKPPSSRSRSKGRSRGDRAISRGRPGRSAQPGRLTMGRNIPDDRHPDSQDQGCQLSRHGRLATPEPFALKTGRGAGRSGPHRMVFGPLTTSISHRIALGP